PGLSGDQLARLCMAVRPEVPVILCTGYSETVDEKAAREMGIRAYLRKPITLRALAACIRNVLKEPVASP
ncbi:MAG: response regulator, partial [Verrucomicrobiota bacterium]